MPQDHDTRIPARSAGDPGTKLVALLPGDGIGPEVVEQATRVIRAVGERWGHDFDLRHAPNSKLS